MMSEIVRIAGIYEQTLDIPAIKILCGAGWLGWFGKNERS